MSEDEYILAFDPAINNMSYCMININTLKIKNWGKFSIKDKLIDNRCINLINYLDSKDLTKDLNTIFIYEQQPTFNMQTSIITGYLQMYFASKKIKCKHNISGFAPNDSKNKLKYYIPQLGDEVMPNERLNNLKKGHYRDKQIAIEHCKRILIQNKESKEWIDFFNNLKKSDDCADSYLLALSYLKNHKLGCFKEKEKQEKEKEKQEK